MGLCRFDLSCPILEKDNFIEIFYIVLSCLNSILFLTLFVSICFDLLLLLLLLFYFYYLFFSGLFFNTVKYTGLPLFSVTVEFSK